MCNNLETKVMCNQKEYVSIFNKVLILLVIALFASCITGTASAKSLYVLSDIRAYPNTLQAYDISVSGNLTLQAQYNIPRYNNGSTQLALDSDSGYLFITYQGWTRIVLVNSKTMIPVTEMVSVPGAYNGLEGIVYNHKKKQLYCVDKGRSRIWVYDWNPTTVKLTLVDGSPFKLQNATAYGIALDETHQLLYVANSTNKVYAYSTADWTLKRTITLNYTALNVAVDVTNNYLYSGAGFIGNPYLTQYNLKTDTQLSTMVESSPDIGVVGIAVDPNTSKVYFTTGHDYLPGGDNIRVYDKLLHPLSYVKVNGNPTGLVIPIKEVGYNPLNLKKEVHEIINGEDLTPSDAVKAGDYVTYRISFDNIKNENTVTNVKVVDLLPSEVSFVSASDDGLFGDYNDVNHTYTWNYLTLVKGSSAYLDIKVKVNQNVLPRTTIRNIVTISSDSTPPVTRSSEVLTNSRPLNVKKAVFGAIEGLTKWVDLDEVITYNISINNNDNDFSATDVIVTDILPDDLMFISADDDVFGIYDANSHTYTWSIPSLAPKEEIDLGITVRLKEDTPEGIAVTNTVTVQSVETALAESSVDIRVGDGPVVIKSEDIRVIPGTNLRRDSALSGVMVVMQMPSGYKATDVKDTPLMLSVIGDLESGTLQANDDQSVIQSQDKTYVIATFDKKKLMEAIPGYGQKYLEITGYLADGGLFTGYVTLNITTYVGY